VGVDRSPPLPADRRRASVKLRRRIRFGVLGLIEHASVAILQNPLDRLSGILLVGADHAARAALDPADGVLATARVVVLVAHTPALVADHPTAFVKRDAVERAAAIADRAEHQATLDQLLVLGGNRATGVIQPVANDAQTTHAPLFVADDLDR
jgi:hypothetical protein